MSQPFSDTTSPVQTLPDVWDQAARLAERLGLPRNVAGMPPDQMRLLFLAMHSVLDRLDKLEVAQRDEPNRG